MRSSYKNLWSEKLSGFRYLRRSEYRSGLKGDYFSISGSENFALSSYLEIFLDTSDTFYIPQAVAQEVSVKQGEVNTTIQQLIDFGKLQVQLPNLRTLVDSINQRLGIGESEVIALAIEMNADYILLDDSAARKEAGRLGLKVRGTLAIIKKLHSENKISIGELEDLYQKLMKIDFRVKRSLFDQIFSNE